MIVVPVPKINRDRKPSCYVTKNKKKVLSVIHFVSVCIHFDTNFKNVETVEYMNNQSDYICSCVNINREYIPKETFGKVVKIIEYYEDMGNYSRSTKQDNQIIQEALTLAETLEFFEQQKESYFDRHGIHNDTCDTYAYIANGIEPEVTYEDTIVTTPIYK